jgi:hypothetical protein
VSPHGENGRAKPLQGKNNQLDGIIPDRTARNQIQPEAQKVHIKKEAQKWAKVKTQLNNTTNKEGMANANI